MDTLLKLVEWLLDRYGQLSTNYPRVTRTMEWALVCVVGIGIAHCLFALYVLNAPRLTVHSYFAALNKREWADASRLLAPIHAGMDAAWLEANYLGFAGHENLTTSLASDQSAIDVFLNDRIRYNVTYEFHVTIAHDDVDNPDRRGDVLWAEIVDAGRLNELRNNPKATPIHLRTQQTKLCTLERYNGRGWLMVDYWTRVTDSLKF